MIETTTQKPNREVNCSSLILKHAWRVFLVSKVELRMWHRKKKMETNTIILKLCVICDCNSITVPPRRPGICCRMARSNSVLWLMVFSLLGKWNIISLNRDMQNEVSTDPSWVPAQSVCGCWVAPQWQIQLIIETSRSWKSWDLALRHFRDLWLSICWGGNKDRQLRLNPD